MNTLHQTTINAMNSLNSQGVDFPQSGTEVSIPSDYSRIPDIGEGNIGELMGALASHIHFLEYKTSLAEVEYESWNNQYEREKKQKMLLIEQERKDLMEAKADAELGPILTIVGQKYAEMKLLKSILDGRKRIFDSLSRELSRRHLIQQMQRAGL